MVAGDGWALVWDAYGFLDPLYSSGVLLALKSADVVGEAVADALDANDPSEARLRRWEPEYNKAMNRNAEFGDGVLTMGLNFGKLVRKQPEKKNLNYGYSHR